MFQRLIYMPANLAMLIPSLFNNIIVYHVTILFNLCPVHAMYALPVWCQLLDDYNLVLSGHCYLKTLLFLQVLHKQLWLVEM